MHDESVGKPYDSTSVLETLSGKLDIKRHSPNEGLNGVLLKSLISKI